MSRFTVIMGIIVKSWKLKKVTVVVPKKVIEYHLSRLKDKNPEVRLKAVKELEIIADPDTLEALQELFNSDDDSAVRKAAQEAGRAIFLKRKEQSSS